MFLINKEFISKDDYFSNLNTFAKKIEKVYGKVINKCKPTFNYDYSFLIETKKTDVPQILIDYFKSENLIFDFNDLLETQKIISLTHK